MNNIIILQYTPQCLKVATYLLADYLQEASTFSADGSPVAICGDFNAPHKYEGPDGSLSARNRTLSSNLGTYFFRARLCGP